MARNRKSKAQKASSSQVAEELDIPEEEQWRIIKDSGILGKVPQPPKEQDGNQEQEESTLGDEIFNASLLVIPMSFLLLLMEILVHYQYGRKPTYEALAERMLPGVPIISVLVFYTNRYKHYRQTQAVLFFLSVAVGSRFIWMIERASWRVVMKQCPPLATLWVYMILQLDLGPAVLGLFFVGIFVWATGLKLSLRP
ncbi:hypothetical protein CERSUDRAFT_111655 [Gelatoporia subvermispora B]|uniref:DUF7719 domain-containing protein n=1 Tax=Ceriporiopsis subvermispora (strain B) TaxID=914234 RepID=M2RRL4_CERS8|nr:hypothetical protein CERSUDRAFT_111655 [Gelatoporia subvermispora B]